ncbi:MAG: DNA polymerase III subunit alpha [Candidatus Pacearchaeota archaeon]
MGFTHLHLHTEYSLLDGATKISELFGKIKELGQNAVAITEHGNMGAVIKKYQLAKKAGVKLIFGFEAYITDDRKKRDKDGKDYHLILLAENYEGYKNLVKLVSIANGEGFYYRPRIDKEILRKYSNGIICMSSCIAGEIAQAAIERNEVKANKLIDEYLDIFGNNNFFLEVQNHFIPEEEIVRKYFKKIGREKGLKIVATVDSHFLNKEDSYAHEVMLAIGTNGDMANKNRFKFDGTGYYVMNEEEVKKLFPEDPEYIDLSCEIANRCNVELDIGKPIFPDFETPDNLSYKDYLYKLCKVGLDEKYGNKKNYKEAIERMEFELGVISKMGFEEYFLIVADFINYAKKFCQVGPGRGSGAGSIVAYSLGITQLDPLELGLLFERFLNPDRISLPDFDVDFGDKEIVLDYVRKKYGEEKIAMIGTFGTMSAKAVLKDVMRVFKIPFDEANFITKLVSEKTIEKSLNAKTESGSFTNDAKSLRDYEKKHEEIFKIAKRLEGCVRHKGVHACGVVWGKKDISDYIPTYSRNGDIITQVEGPDIEAYGLVKFDFLGLETLNIIKKVLDMVGKDSAWLENLPLDDDSVYEMLREAKSIGVFQVESEGMRKTLKLVKPTCFDDIIAIVALYRPGPMQYLEVYANRKHGRESSIYPHEKAEKVLASTYGIMVYQEQVMQLSRVLANFSMGDSDILRKAIGKKKLDLMEKMEGQFKKGCVEFSGMKKNEVDKLWSDIVKFAEYSFNKSHAAAYALISYRTAYLKKYYPTEFYAATISSSVSDPDKLAFYLEAARAEGIEILHPDINTSEEGFSVENKEGKKELGELVQASQGKKVIRVGLSGIKNVGEEALKKIMEQRPFKSYQDFINRVDTSKVNKRICHSLISVGCFDSLGVNRSVLLAVYEKIIKEDNGNEKQMTLFGGIANKVQYPDLPPMEIKQMLELECELLGACVSCHQTDAFPESKMDFTPICELREGLESEIFGVVKRYSKILTKSGDDMCFMNIADKTGEIKVTIFPRDYENTMRETILKEGDGVRVRGRFVEDEKFGNGFVAKEVLVCKAMDRKDEKIGKWI